MTMKAIITKYHGPTDHRGSRIIASDCDGNRISISYDDALSMSNGENHRKAAEALRDKMGWTGELIEGDIKGGYVFVFAPRDIHGSPFNWSSVYNMDRPQGYKEGEG